MGRKKIEINELKTEEIASIDTNTPTEQENANTEDCVKIDAENTTVEPAEKEEEKEIDKITFDGQEISLENATLEDEEVDLTIPKDEIKDEPTELSNFIFLLEEIIDLNQDVDFDILNLKNQIRKLIAEFK